MERRSNMGSSIYTSDLSQKQGSQLEHKLKSKPRIKIQIVNQNLQEAIRDVRNHVKQNPEWNLNVKKVAEQYKPNKERAQPINQTIQEQIGVNLLPLSFKQPPLSSHFEPIRRPDFEKLKYTDRQKREYQQRMKQLKEKRMQLEVNSLEKQMKAKLQKKIKQNILLKEKAKILHEIQEEREKRMRLRDRMSHLRNQQQSLLHQSNVANVEMLRRYKKKSKKRELNQNHSKSQQSAVELKFKQFLTQQQKIERKDILIARYRAMRTASQGSLRKIMGDKRSIHTAFSAKRLANSKQSDFHQ